MSDAISRLNEALSGRYTLERELGEGGMATVYLAHDVRHDRPVALKVLKPELAAVIGGERFLTEITTTAKLQHPHILPLFDSGEAGSFLFYVMPFVEGESLRERLDREKQLGVEESLRIARDVADALDYAHRQGVIHRDIKPANILLHDGRPVVADFGIAVAISAAGGGRLTETGMSVGTPHYMSPEQATAERDLSPRSDVYSLACVLYEMLAGDPPHVGPTAQAILMRILTEDPRSVTDVRKAVPPHVSAVLAKSLEKLPADRFESAAEFAAALADESFAHTRVARAQDAPTSAPAAVGATDGVSRSLFLGVAGLAFAAFAIAAWGWMRPAPETDSGAPTRLPIELDMPIQDEDEIVVSPDGSRFAVAATVDGVRALYWRRASEDAFRLIPGTQDAEVPAFSPNGEWLVFRTDADVLLKVSLLGGAPTPVVPAGPVDPREPSWDEEGTIVFGGPDGVFRVPDTGGQPELLYELSQQLRKPSLLPGGGILGADRGGAGVTYLAPGADTVQVLIPAGLDPKFISTGHILYADAGGGLWAAPFDPERGEVLGGGVPVLDGLRVIRGVHARYSISRNGTLVYGSGGASGAIGRGEQMVVVSLDGTATPLPLDPRQFSDLRWSPDGGSVVYAEPDGNQGNENIFTYDVELGTTPRQLTYEGDNFQPVWSPDGTRVAFASSRDGSDAQDLYVKDVNSDAPPQLLLTLPGSQRPEHWPDDTTLVFRTGNPPDQWIASLAGDSAVAREYLSSEDALFAPAVAPDGELVAYQDCGTPGCDIYVRSFPTPGARERISTGGGQSPLWSPDGDTVYFWTPDNSGLRSFVAARVDRGPPFVVTARDTLFAGRFSPFAMDLHPDGDRLITLRPTPGAMDAAAVPIAAERFLVVVNWFEELRERLGDN